MWYGFLWLAASDTAEFTVTGDIPPLSESEMQLFDKMFLIYKE